MNYFRDEGGCGPCSPIGEGPTARSVLNRVMAAIAVLGCVLLMSAAQSDQDTTPLKFAVASIRSIGQTPGKERVKTTPLGLDIRNASLKKCISLAYGVTVDQVSGPDWLFFEKYDIEAKAEDPTSPDRLRLMMQSLLSERFKMVCHREMRPIPLYQLTVGKKGFRGNPADTDDNDAVRVNSNTFEFHHVSMDEFADALRGLALDHAVVNLTGLAGTFDLRLTFPPGVRPRLSNTGSSVSIFAVLEEQLGLKLELRNTPTEVIVIDHAEKVPTEN